MPVEAPKHNFQITNKSQIKFPKIKQIQISNKNKFKTDFVL
jgi:hypothetical protein